MELFPSELIEQMVKTLVLVAVPTLLIPCAALGFSVLQGMMGIRDGSLQYAVRALALVAVVALFGASFGRSFVELMQMALR